MKMTERIRKLREQSLNAENRISAERALLITEFYQSGMADAEPVPVQRALAFKYILEHKYICVNEGELIVGERGPAPKATPTYPEICIHSLQDLEILTIARKYPLNPMKLPGLLTGISLFPTGKGKVIATGYFRICHRSGKRLILPVYLRNFRNKGRRDIRL